MTGCKHNFYSPFFPTHDKLFLNTRQNKEYNELEYKKNAIAKFKVIYTKFISIEFFSTCRAHTKHSNPYLWTPFFRIIYTCFFSSNKVKQFKNQKYYIYSVNQAYEFMYTFFFISVQNRQNKSASENCTIRISFFFISL